MERDTGVTTGQRYNQRLRDEGLRTIISGLGVLAWGALMVVVILYADRPVDGRPAPSGLCTDLYEDRPVVETVPEEFSCRTVDGGLAMSANTVWECRDGRTLWSNPFGWGYVGAQAQEHEPGQEQVPWTEITLCTG